MSKKKNHYSCEGRIENSAPQDHCLSSLSKPRDAKRRYSGRIFLSYHHTHDRFLYFSGSTPNETQPSTANTTGPSNAGGSSQSTATKHTGTWWVWIGFAL